MSLNCKREREGLIPFDWLTGPTRRWGDTRECAYDIDAQLADTMSC